MSKTPTEHLITDCFTDFILSKKARRLSPRTIEHYEYTLTPFINEHADLPAAKLKTLIKECTSDRDRVIVLLLADTGMRMSECLGLEWRDIDIATGHAQLRKTKNRRECTAFIGAKTSRALL